MMNAKLIVEGKEFPIEILDPELQELLTSPQKHGQWLIDPDGYYPYCSECGKEPQGREMTKFCPNCGTEMDYKYSKLYNDEQRMKCKDCDYCHMTAYTRWNPQERCMQDVQVYECWGVREPFVIKDTNRYCTEYPDKRAKNKE